MQQVVGELAKLNVSVDLLILVDPSQTLDNNQISQVKEISTNVKRVYNFHQTQNSTYNEGQNGFSISFQAPTIGANIDVKDGYTPYGTLCGNVGHGHIDNCDNLQSVIKKLIREVLPSQNLTPIYNLLLD